LKVVLVALRQARPREADGMGRPGRPLRRSTRRDPSQRDEFPPHGDAARCNKLRSAQRLSGRRFGSCLLEQFVMIIPKPQTTLGFNNLAGGDSA